ncbi:hypothetical protein KCTC32516_00745 [Polaribacter huanghezhanensis]|uniref:DUF4270 family protein n=1 Tax=Polaribacter huanghezhanensis TaxID=1354726 RepID=UPI002649C47D|nr:DUF4270 family protein [Polaribacter huanghezhanensis]WKD85405.1 hypothetical protein KCTC32516_00745 [Polaribacter huanghezhanensis]
MIKKSAYISVFILLITMVVSCEKDFTDIATSVVSNTKFETKDTIIDVVVTNKQITSVRADGLTIGGSLGQYLLGVYNNTNYEKVEASTVSQLVLDQTLKTKDKGERIYGNDTTVVTTIDTVFLKLPYQATLKTGTTSGYTLDSIIGDQTKAFTLNLYRTDTYMSRLNPADPSKASNFPSNKTYQILPGELNAQINYPFMPKATDTMMVFKRRLSNGTVYKTDTIRLSNNNPFARVTLDETKIKQIFVDQFETSNFESQDAIEQYFKGLYMQASGNEGSLISFNINNLSLALRPSIEIRYTKTVLKGGTTVLDTIEKTNSFLLSNFSTSVYKMDEKAYPNNGNIVLQGTAGNMAQVQLFAANELASIISKNWLVNDADLTFYVNQNVVGTDTISTPHRLFLYKDGNSKAQIKDVVFEGPTSFGGSLVTTSKKPDYYTFKITDYISDLVSGKTSYNPILGLKVINSSDFPNSATDTLVANYSWNPKVVTLLNHSTSNGTRKARLKITYSKRK